MRKGRESKSRTPLRLDPILYTKGFQEESCCIKALTICVYKGSKRLVRTWLRHENGRDGCDRDGEEREDR